MVKKLRKYNIRYILNHSGDYFNLAASIVFMFVFLTSHFGVTYS